MSHQAHGAQPSPQSTPSPEAIHVLAEKFKELAQALLVLR